MTLQKHICGTAELPLSSPGPVTPRPIAGTPAHAVVYYTYSQKGASPSGLSHLINDKLPVLTVDCFTPAYLVDLWGGGGIDGGRRSLRLSL